MSGKLDMTRSVVRELLKAKKIMRKTKIAKKDTENVSERQKNQTEKILQVQGQTGFLRKKKKKRERKKEEKRQFCFTDQ